MVSRRRFVQSLGAGAAGVLSPSFIGARGREAAEAAGPAGVDWLPAQQSGLIRLASNENPNGPCRAALDAIRAALVESNRYPFGPAAALQDAIAAHAGVPASHVMLGCGSGDILRIATRAATGPGRALVTAAPTFESPEGHAAAAGAEVRALPVTADLQIDLDAMLAAAPGAGLFFVCNPNNPTGTLHSGDAIEAFVARARKAAPDALILIDEAYHEYVEDPSYRSAVTLISEPNVLVSRTFSKVYGMAGLRVGYALANPETLDRLRGERLGNSVNVLGAAAALAALNDADVIASERRLNRDARDFTRAAFARLGYPSLPSHANFVMVDVRGEARAFAQACRTHGVAVGRPFPPLLRHARVSIGTMDEMTRAVAVFERVLR
jgi:histidinol-phosphate aminotransferase